MTRIVCRECRAPLPGSTDACSGCGCSSPRRSPAGYLLGTLGLSGFLCVVAGPVYAGLCFSALATLAVIVFPTR